MKSCPTIPVPQAKSILTNLRFYISEMKLIYEEWWRWRPPLLLILLRKSIIYLILRPNLPPNSLINSIPT